MHQQKNQGFTLMELMIVVAIVGILASIAVPSYGKYVTDARRLDGQVALRNAAQFMERCRTQSFTYENCDTSARAPSSSEEGHYDLAYSNVAGTTFTITAEPPAGSKQANDSECATLTIDQTGAVDSTPASTPDGVCW